MMFGMAVVRKGRCSMWVRNLVVNGFVLGAVTAAGAQERKIMRSELPPAVAATVDRETKGATIKGFTTEREHGRTMYEAETVVNGRTRDIEIAQNGQVNEVEEELDMASLPATVQEALSAKAAGGGRIAKVESLTKDGKLVAYEAAMVKNGRLSEFQVGPNGGALAHEED
jgi:hypothetical protein